MLAVYEFIACIAEYDSVRFTEIETDKTYGGIAICVKNNLCQMIKINEKQNPVYFLV